MITPTRFLLGWLLLSSIGSLSACEPKGCTLITKTMELRPIIIKTLVAEQYPTSGLFLCPFGVAPLQPAPFSVIVGYSHELNETFFCDKASDHIYQGAVWFPVRENLKNKFVQKAVLKFTFFDSNPRCLIKICSTEFNLWINDTSNKTVSVTDCIAPLPLQGQEFSVDVTNMVRYWTQGSVENNGFILAGPKDNFASFSMRGMLKNENCLAYLRDFLLVITYVEKSP